MLTVGLTGGIASGKSLASQYFSDLGIDIIDADLIAQELFKPNSPHLTPLRDHFGDSVFSSNGELKRKALGQRVFADPVALKWLNDLTHPLIRKKMKSQLAQVKSAYAILDIPLLIDTKGSIPTPLSKILNRVLVISTDVPTQIKHLMQRDRVSQQYAMQVVETQSSWEQKQQLADDIIENNRSIEHLKKQVGEMHKYYLSLELRT